MVSKNILGMIGVIGLVGSASIFAADGTISITGKVVDASCAISINGATANGSVVLPGVAKGALGTAGSTAGTTPVKMALSGCPTTGGVRAFFEADNVDNATGYLKNNAASAAGNVQVQVMNSAMQSIDLRTNSNNTPVAFDASGNAELQYNVSYIAVGAAATAGDVSTSLVYSLDYQ